MKVRRPDRALGLLSNECAELRDLIIIVLSSLRSLPAARLLVSKTGRGTLQSDLLRVISTTASSDPNFDRIKPLLIAALTDKPDSVIWHQVYNAVTESTPPRSIASSVQQTPWLHNTSSFANSSEQRKYVDGVLKEELGFMHVGLHNFHETFFGDVADLKTASKTFFGSCVEGGDPLFVLDDGWRGWPDNAQQDDVLIWFANFCDELEAFIESYKPSRTRQRRLLAQPNKSIQGSTAQRKLDVGFVTNRYANKESRCHWSEVLVPGELKSNVAADKALEAWLDIGRYAREVLAAQDTRRFVLGFTICGSLMRIWEFDRLGGIASEQFDINKDGLRFVSTILGFLWMSEEELGFDPTILTANGERFIDIERDGLTERIVIDKVMQRARCIAGRATTCWKAHPEGYPQRSLVIKDSWQYPEREEEGELLSEATSRGVINVARYYFHNTVKMYGKDDDIRSNVRKGLNVATATNYRPERSLPPPSIGASITLRRGRSSGSAASKKRLSSQTGAPLSPSKRSYSASLSKAGDMLSNRVHRRVILSDYGKPIYKASSRAALLAALEGSIKGHESLHHAGFLHRDISVNNIMINEDKDNPSWPSFLIDLDLAIREQRQSVSGARGKTGTRVFMAIGVLLGEKHSFMHDLESFFWVLFWICIHYDGPESRVVPEFDQWNSISMDSLAKQKKGQVAHEGDFVRSAEENFTPYYQPLAPWVNRLRKVVFPNGGRWEGEDTGLYARMREIMREAREDPIVSAES